jgi:tetratricopeptide (TPR) repeat protein
VIRAALAVPIALIALAAAHAPEAHAGGTPDRTVQARAGALFERALKHYQAGQYSEAIKLFAEAYELVHDPVYLFNLGQSYRKVLDCVKASESYQRYLTDATDADAKQRERVEQWLREIAPCVEQRREETERARRAEEAERARRAEEERQRQLAAASRPREIDRGRGFRIAGLVAAGVGAAGLGLGGWFSVRGSHIKAELADECRDGCDWELLRDRNAAGERANTIAAIGWIGGGVAAAGGVALYLLGRSRIEHVQIAPVQGGAALAARLSF